MRAFEPPCPTRNRTHLAHFGQRARYTGDSGRRYTRMYCPAHTNRTPIQGFGVRGGPAAGGVGRPGGLGTGGVIGIVRRSIGK
jgi:hypothetical protein